MIVIPDVDGYAKTLNHRKYSEKRKKTTFWKTTGILKKRNIS